MLISLASDPESTLTVFTGAIKKAVKEKVKHMNITIGKKNFCFHLVVNN